MENAVSAAGYLNEKPPVAAESSGSSKTAKLDPQPRAMATIQNDDERMLARIGYKQVPP